MAYNDHSWRHIALQMLEQGSFLDDTQPAPYQAWDSSKCCSLTALLLFPGVAPPPPSALACPGATGGLTLSGFAGALEQPRIKQAVQRHLERSNPCVLLADGCTAPVDLLFVRYVLPELEPKLAEALHSLDWCAPPASRTWPWLCWHPARRRRSDLARRLTAPACRVDQGMSFRFAGQDGSQRSPRPRAATKLHIAGAEAPAAKITSTELRTTHVVHVQVWSLPSVRASMAKRLSA